MPTLSDRLIQLKIERNLMQKDIAKDNNISLRAYQYYERGERKPDSDTIIKLADYFDISTDYLLGRSDNPQRQ
ncbi:MAG: helix-turn-helix domain-containing protein [Defluviitaleaceae bacterium]|nr:helix-turn-helix domain-containing protein [Defluviitaleaceae bacterium]